jgi:hypothetical protein
MLSQRWSPHGAQLRSGPVPGMPPRPVVLAQPFGVFPSAVRGVPSERQMPQGPALGVLDSGKNLYGTGHGYHPGHRGEHAIVQGIGGDHPRDCEP